MPRVIRQYIEFDVEVRDARRTSFPECHICKNEFCPNDECCRASTSMSCCEQSMCVACLAKMSKRCTCSEECDIVISYCAFCREIGPVSSLDIYLGLKGILCSSCNKLPEEETPLDAMQEETRISDGEAEP
jgi:hypothetical protein